MSVITVQGEVSENNIEIILPHEHIFLDVRNRLQKNLEEITEITKRNLAKDKVKIDNLGYLKLDAFSILDNLVLADFETATKEVLEFKKFGGNTIIDQTNRYMGRDPIALRNISNITGINIIAATGFYLEGIIPENIKKKRKNELASLMIKEIQNGIDETKIKAGVIGEIGTSKYITEIEEKFLRASAIAQCRTGTALFIHAWPWNENGLKIIDILEDEGCDLKKVVICHVDGESNIKYYENIIKKGVCIEFDNFGKNYFINIDGELLAFSNDLMKIKAIKTLIEKNPRNIKNILISSDICLKIDLIQYGGFGYAHILKNIIPIMHKFGIDEAQISQLISKNPKELINIK